jgi:Ca2+ transporting ATPase
VQAGGIRAIARGVGSSPNRGLTGDDTELRKRKYGTNTIERAPSPTFFELFMGAMEDTTVIILLVAAAVSIIMSIITCSADLSPSCPRRSWGGRELWAAMGGSPPGHSSQEDGLPGTSNIGPHDERTDTDCSGWMDGVCIIIACVLVGLITAWNETSKETHFRHLQKQQDVDITVTVKRNDEIVRFELELWNTCTQG